MNPWTRIALETIILMAVVISLAVGAVYLFDAFN